MHELASRPVLSGVLAAVAAAVLNRLHRFYAAHLERVGRHITANFDNCIEKAAVETLPKSAVDDRVLHFHGSLFAGRHPDPNQAGLPATTRRETGGLGSGSRGSPVLSATAAATSSMSMTTIAALPEGALAGVRVVWVAHSDHP